MVMLKKREKIDISDIDIKNYAEFILRDGSNFEKRELLGCLKSKIMLKNKAISIYPHNPSHGN